MTLSPLNPFAQSFLPPVCVPSHVQLFATPWTVDCQAPLSMGFSKQEYCSGLPFCPPGDLSNPGIEFISLTSPALTGRFFTTTATWDFIHSTDKNAVLRIQNPGC